MGQRWWTQSQQQSKQQQLQLRSQRPEGVEEEVLGRRVTAEEVFARMRARGVAPNELTYGTVIDMYVRGLFYVVFSVWSSVCACGWVDGWHGRMHCLVIATIVVVVTMLTTTTRTPTYTPTNKTAAPSGATRRGRCGCSRRCWPPPARGARAGGQGSAPTT